MDAQFSIVDFLYKYFRLNSSLFKCANPQKQNKSKNPKKKVFWQKNFFVLFCWFGSNNLGEYAGDFDKPVRHLGCYFFVNAISALWTMSKYLMFVTKKFKKNKIKFFPFRTF